MKFYQPEIALFGGFESNASEGLDQYAQHAETFFVWGHQPDYSSRIRLLGAIPCLQMLLEKPVNLAVQGNIVPLVTTDQFAQLYKLVWKVQPGYFQPRTTDMGNYFGIYQNDQLVAAAGERMKWNAYSEVSAVVTHPDYTGRGYASQLVKQVTDKIFAENKIPCLHVADSNAIAIRLYHKLGFHTRRQMPLWKFGQ